MGGTLQPVYWQADNSITGGMEVRGAPGSGGGSGITVPATNRLWVDNKRTDSYTANGAVTTPFKTIAAAVAAIVAAGDNSVTNPYSLNLATSTYLETLDLSNPALKCIYVFGNGAEIGSTSTTAPAFRVVNNDNLTDVWINNVFFLCGNGGTHLMDFESSTNGTNLFNTLLNGNGLILADCLIGASLATPDFYVNNTGGILIDRCTINCAGNITNCAQMIMRGGAGIAGGANWAINTLGAPTPAGFSSTSLNCRYINISGGITVNNNSVYSIQHIRQAAGITLNDSSLCINRLSTVSATITVAAGATYTETGGNHTGALNNSGTYNTGGAVGALAALILGGATGPKISSGSGSPNTVVTGSPGDLYLNTGGGSATTLWVKESGSGTNTGWVGK